MNIPWSLVMVAAGALALTALLTPLVRGAAIAAGKVSGVRKDRWHRRPTPTLGGVALFLGFGLVLVASSTLLDLVPTLLHETRRGILPWSVWEGLVAAGTLAFLVGLVDDFVHLSPVSKLVGQVAAASLLLMSGIGLWLSGIYVVDAFLSLLWFVGITNALNLLDNMDGLAGGVALIACVFLGTIFLLEGSPELAALTLALAGALLGFLLYNYPPARIFMGDSGSLFLGMTLSGLALSPGAGLSRSLLAVVAVPVLILVVPILDTSLVTMSRVLEGRSPAEGGRDHSSHRLVSLGMSEERVLWILWTLAVLAGAVGLLLRATDRTWALLGGGLMVAVLVLVGGYLLHVRFRHLEKEDISSTALYQRLVRLHARFPVLLMGLDVLLVGLAYYGAYLVRWTPPQLEAELEYFRQSLPVVLALKLLVYGMVEVYGVDLRRFGLSETLHFLRANFFASVTIAASLFMLQRTGLSRGVLVIDFLLSSILVLGARFSFRIMEGWARRWSREGVPAVILGAVDDMDLALGEMERGRWPGLRPVALADRRVSARKGRLRGYALFGGRDALERAFRETEAGALVLVEREGEQRGEGTEGGEEPLLEVPADRPVEVYALRLGITLSRQGGDGGRQHGREGRATD